MYQTLKKVFSAFVSLTTIAWSVGLGTLALPSVASAASIASGDLIKASGPAVYYYGADGKRYVFPNEKTYFTWYADFSMVKTITDSELAAIQIGGNVTYKPGVKMVKITTDPKVYAVAANGTLRWVMSEACAITLYGSNWNHMIDDVSDAFFVNYQTGAAIDCSGSTFNPAAATAAATSINVDKGLTTGGPVTGGSVSVALASDTPAGINVPKNGSSIPMLKVNFTAGSAAVNITGLTFHRTGIGSAGDFANVYLYDGSGLRLSTGRTVNSQSNLVSFNGLNINIAAGATWSAQLYADFAVAAGSTGGQHAFEIADAASVVVNGNGTVSGAFAVRGNVFTVGTASSARVDVQKGSQPSNPTIGAQDTEISNFKVTANTNDISLKQITLYQAGSVTNSDISMFKLYQGSTVVATADSVGTDGHIFLKFNPAYLITNGTTKVFSLHANVGGRAGRTIRTYVEYTTDVTAIDTVYNAGASICINTATTACAGSPANMDGTGGSGVSPITNGNFIEVLTQGGQLTNAFNGPATTNIAKGQLAVPLYKFSLTSPDNTLEVRKIVFTIAKTAGSAGTCNVVGAAGTNYFRSIKIKNMDTGVTWMGPIDFSAGTATSKTVTFTDTQNINAGQSLNLALVADLSNSEDVGDTFLDGACAYQASFTAFGSSDIRVVSTGEFLDTSKIVPNTNVTGNALTVKSSGLTASLASNPVSGTLVKKQQNVQVAGLTLTAAAQSDITITNLTLTGQAALAASGCAFGTGSCAAANFAQRVTSLALFDGATQVGQAKAPDTVTGKAQIANMNLLIAKGTTKNLTIVASFSSTASTTAPFDKIAVGVATANDIQAQDQDANTVVPSLDAAVTNQSTGGAIIIP